MVMSGSTSWEVNIHSTSVLGHCNITTDAPPEQEIDPEILLRSYIQRKYLRSDPIVMRVGGTHHQLLIVMLILERTLVVIV